MATLEEILATPGTQPQPQDDLGDLVVPTKDWVYPKRAGLEGVTVAADESLIRLLITCFGCNEYALDGCLTAYETDEGTQPFCPECVRAIEARSKNPEPASVYVDGQLVVGVKDIQWEFKTVGSSIPGAGLHWSSDGMQWSYNSLLAASGSSSVLVSEPDGTAWHDCSTDSATLSITGTLLAN